MQLKQLLAEENHLIIDVGVRQSPLSLTQAEEVLCALRHFHPHISFNLVRTITKGDLDKKTSLRSLEKTDFFTDEIDRMQLDGDVRIAIHSAKDLPDPLAQGLSIAAITKGVDPRDALVMCSGDTFETLPPNSKIGTSSLRREETIRALRSDLSFVDIRGTIEERYAQLIDGKVDGVVIAEAALIRLGMTGLNRIFLPGETAPLQGKLAVIIREEDAEMRELFSLINSQE